MGFIIYLTGLLKRPLQMLARLSFVILSIAAFFFISCQNDQTPTDDELIAKVYNHSLYRSDIKDFIPAGMSAQDSAQLFRRFLDNWVQQHVILHNAMENLSSEQMNFERKIEDYRTSLIVFAYETQLVKQYLDTLVGDSEIAEYYEIHQNSFKLKDDIAKVVYVKVPLDTPEIWRLRNLYRTSDPQELVQLEEYCVQHAATYLIDRDTWLLFRDILREVPINTNNPESFLRSNKYVELSDSYYRYFLHILDYRLKGSVSPLAFERDNVRAIILNQRKHKFISERRSVYLEQAIRDRQLETFY